MQLKKISYLLLIVTEVVIPGCNSGSYNRKSLTKELTTTGIATAVTGNGKKANANKLPGYTPLDRAELGWGYDPATNSILPINSIDPSQLIAPDGTFEVISEATQYNDYSTFAQDLSISMHSNSYSFAGGIGVSYGLYAGSLKAAYAEAASNAEGALTINKAVGLAGTMRIHFPLTYSKLSLVEKQQVGGAIYQAAGQTFKDGLDMVRNAPNNVAKSQAILDFYASYGTHFISSVTKGYMGVTNISLSQVSAQGATEKSGSIAGSFSSPFAKAEANYSQSNSSGFSKDNWTYSATTFTTPDDNDIRDSLSNLLRNMQDELDKQSDKLSFDKLSDYQAKVKSEIKLPDLSSLNINVDPTAQNEAKQKSLKYRTMVADLSSLDKLNTQIQALVAKRDSIVDQTERERQNTKIQAQIDAQSTFKSLLSKFDLGGEYELLTLNSQQAINLNTYRELYDELSFNIDTPSQEILDAQAKIKEDIDRQAKIEKDKVGFQTWLQNSVFPVDGKDHTSFEVWFNSLSLAKLKQYGVDFQKYLQKAGYVPAEDGNGIKAMHQRILLNHQKSYSKLALQAGDNQPATLDFDIVPWATIFPELNSSAVFISGPTDLIKIKILRKLNKISDIRSYLLLCAKVTNSAFLNNAYTQDSLTNYNNLRDLLNSFSFSSDILKFAGKYYDLNSTEDVGALEQGIDNSISKLSMVQNIPNWYKTTEVLLAKGLIAPQGIALAIQNFDRPQYGRLLSATPQANEWLKVSQQPLSVTVGQQLADIIGNKPHYNNFTAELIVGDSSQIESNLVNNVRILFSQLVNTATGESINSLNKLWSFDLTPTVDGFYSTINTQTDGIIEYSDNTFWKWRIPSNKISYSYPVKLLAHSLGVYDTETLRTALGGRQAAQKLDPTFKLFYSGEGSANTDILYDMYNINGY